MAFTEKNLGQATISNASNTTLYTTPALTKGIVKDLHIANITSSDATVDIWFIPTGSSATNANLMFKTYWIPANDIRHWTGFKVLNATGTVQALASASNTIVITVDGAEIT